jgi:hypothetical protein
LNKRKHRQNFPRFLHLLRRYRPDNQSIFAETGFLLPEYCAESADLHFLLEQSDYI